MADIFDEVTAAPKKPTAAGDIFDQVETPSPGITSVGDVAKRAAIGAVTTVSGLGDLAANVVYHGPRATFEKIKAGQLETPLTSETRKFYGVKEPETLGEKGAELFGALAVPMSASNISTPMGLLSHLYQSGLGAAGGATVGEVGKAIGGPVGEAIGTAAGTVLAPATAGRIGTRTLKEMTTAERQAANLAKGAEVTEKVPTLPATEKQIRSEFEARQMALGRDLVGEFEPAPGVLSAADSVTARQPSAGLLSDLLHRADDSFHQRFEALEGPHLKKEVRAGATTALADNATEWLNDVSMGATTRLRKLLNDMKALGDRGTGTIVINGEKVPLSSLPPDIAEQYVKKGGSEVKGAAEAVTLGDLKELRQRAKDLAKSANATEREIGGKAKSLLLQTSMEEGLPRDLRLNAEYTLFNPDAKRKVISNLARVRDPSQMAAELEPAILHDVWGVATDAERHGIRQTIAQWADSTGDPVGAILKKYNNTALDTFFDGAGKNGDLLRIKAMSDDLPKLFKQAPDLEQQFMTLARKHALEAYKPLSLPQGLVRRALYGAEIGLGAIVGGGAFGTYAAGALGAAAAGVTNRLINKGVAMALESPLALKALGKPIRVGDTSKTISELAKLAGRALAYDAVAQQHDAVRAQNETGPVAASPGVR